MAASSLQKTPGPHRQCAPGLPPEEYGKDSSHITFSKVVRISEYILHTVTPESGTSQISVHPWVQFNIVRLSVPCKIELHLSRIAQLLHAYPSILTSS